jgi:hypothetical protein
MAYFFWKEISVSKTLKDLMKIQKLSFSEIEKLFFKKKDEKMSSI